MEIYTMPGHLIRRLNQISTGIFMDRMNEQGINVTPVQFSALCAIGRYPGIDQATVAGLIAYDRATLGKVIDRLEARGFVRRETSPKDRRAKLLTLTQQGEAFYQNIRPMVHDMQTDMLHGLTEAERDVFLKLLGKITLAGNNLSRAPLDQSALEAIGSTS